jgi:site-specific recombinase XerD
MATLKFYLKPANKKNQYPVMLCYQDRGKKFRYFTKILLGKPGLQNNRVKASSLADFAINDKLKALEEIIFGIEKEAAAKGVRYSIDTVESLFRQIMSLETTIRVESLIKSMQSQFFDHYDQFVEGSRATKSKSTIANYRMCKSTLLAFEAELGHPITYESINGKFYDVFHNYLVIERKFLNNTVGSRIKNLKVFLNYAMRNELTDKRFNFKDFKTINEEVDIVTLSENELFRIFRCNSLTDSQKIARDYLCFECFTGLRFSDIGKLSNDNIKDQFIVLKTKKTKDNLFIPINVFANEILNRYSGKYSDRPLPPPFANQVVNRLIKEVAKTAKVEDMTMIEKFNGSNRITTSKPKYYFISTHTGRRTFITLSYEKGMQTEMIMKITGIKKWETLKRYLKVSEKSKLIKMNEFWNYDTMNASV